MDVLILVGVLLILIAVFCRLHDRALPPSLHFNDSLFNKRILQQCPMLLSPYVPTFLWGKSGHIQTFIYGKMGRINSPKPRGQRHFHVLKDGATMSFDVFQPTKVHQLNVESTLLVCPGIANSSESVYIRTYIQHAQDSGFRVAVLNHLGSLRYIALTAPRIFTYGGTEEYSVMVEEVRKLYPDSTFIAVGFSMGGNVITKYLGERPERQLNFIGAVCCCQGYDVSEVAPYLMSWRGLRRCYVMAMTQHMKGLLRHHSGMLFGPEAVERYGEFDLKKIFAARILLDIDVNYTYRRAGFNSCEEFYEWCSSRNFINNIRIPCLFLNAMDDPLVPPELLYIPQEFAAQRNNVIVAVTQHGGHLGYFEGGLLVPNDVTWLDRVVVEYCNGLLSTRNMSDHHTTDVVASYPAQASADTADVKVLNASERKPSVVTNTRLTTRTGAAAAVAVFNNLVDADSAVATTTTDLPAVVL